MNGFDAWYAERAKLYAEQCTPMPSLEILKSFYADEARQRQPQGSDEVVELRKRVAALERFIRERPRLSLSDVEFADSLVTAATRGDARAIGELYDALEPRIKALEARPQMKYAGVWREGCDHLEGEFVTYRGSMWYCHTPTNARPGTSPDWQLCVRSGRPGKDGVPVKEDNAE
jgi:hypothetical protein